MQSNQKISNGLIWPTAIVISFLAVISVNIFMVRLAFKSDPGVLESQPYERGLEYQNNIDAKQAFAKHGWNPIVTLKPIENTQKVIVQVKITAQDSSPINGLTGEVKALRASDSKLDRTGNLAMTEPGIYQTELELGGNGLWILKFKFNRNQEIFLLEKEWVL